MIILRYSLSALLWLLLLAPCAAKPVAAPQTKNYADSLYLKAGEKSAVNNFDEAERLVLEGVEYSRTRHDSSQVAKGYNELAEIYFFRKDLNKAKHYAEQAQSYCVTQCDTSVMLKTAGVLGGITNFQGDYNQSLKHYREALKLSELSGLDDQYHDILFNMSNSLGDVGHFEEMLSALIKCKDYYDGKNKPEKLATIHNNLGLIYQEHFGDYKKALKNYHIAIGINKRTDNQWDLARDYNNISLVFLLQDRYDSAHYYLSMAIDIKKELNDEGGLAMMYNAMGKLLLKRGSFEEARSYFQRSNDIAEKYGIAEGQYYNSLGLGQANDSLGNSAAAFDYYQNALAFAKQSGRMEFLQNSMKHLYRHYKVTGRYREALNMAENLKVYEDSLNNRLFDEKVLEVRTKYESELSEKENELLRAQQAKQQAMMQQSEVMKVVFLIISAVAIFTVIALFIAYKSRGKAYKLTRTQKGELEQMNVNLQSKTGELDDINRSKDRLFSVISHDLRGPLGSLESGLSILLSEPLDEEERNSLIEDLRNEAQNTMSALHDLLTWSKMQIGGTSIDKKAFDVNGLLQEVKELYAPLARNKNIVLAFDQQEEHINVHADPSQIKTVVRNLLSNAIKFTPENGRVQLQVKKQGDEVEVAIIDQGSGISDAKMEKIRDRGQYYSSPGTVGEDGTGLGLMLSFEYLQRNDSQLIFEKNTPTGTKALFRLKTAKGIEE